MEPSMQKDEVHLHGVTMMKNGGCITKEILYEEEP